VVPKWFLEKMVNWFVPAILIVLVCNVLFQIGYQGIAQLIGFIVLIPILLYITPFGWMILLIRRLCTSKNN